VAADIEARSPAPQYAQPLGPFLPIPQAVSPQIQELLNSLYRGALTQNPLGNGSTADAVRHERLTGTDVFGQPLTKRNIAGHTQKAEEAVLKINGLLKTDLHPSDRQILQNELDSLKTFFEYKTGALK
jgi:hypothetical protein